MTFDHLLTMAAHYTVTETASRADRNSIFVCIRGARADGHRFAEAAYAKGCRLFVAEHSLPLPGDAITVTVTDTHTALAALACAHSGNPSRKLRVIGVTGTKGKTTTAALLFQILNRAGIRCGYIGTNGIFFGDGRSAGTVNTTPDAVTLQNTLAEMVASGCSAVALEVSSQALKLGRVAGTVFDTCIFTNLSPDHIGPAEHPDFTDYAACKKRLFVDYPCSAAVCNLDDAFSETILTQTHAAVRLTCSVGGIADYVAQDILPYRTGTALGSCFSVRLKNREQVSCRLPLIGNGNVSNALLSLACAVERFGIPPTDVAQALESAEIPGRSEVVNLQSGATAVIDYAHNGVSLRRLLTDMRGYHPNRLICLFGSVGERTRLRRRELGEVAGALADLCILTSDNPGNESPQAIISDIAEGVDPATPCLAIPDRETAIRRAVELLLPGDILVLAGKGHERYQLIGNKKIPFCEREILLQAEKEEVVADHADRQHPAT